MKYILMVMILIFGWIITSSRSQQPVDNSPTLSSISPIPRPKSATPKKTIDLPYREGQLTIAWYEVNNTESIDLIPNYSDPLTSSQLIEQNKCIQAINAGFYDQSRQPIGLFVTQSTIKHPYVKNQTLNGIFAVDEAGNATISFHQPALARIAVQSGPVLVHEEQPIKLSIHNDKQSRRSVAAVAKNNSVFFLTIFNSENTFEGPLLADTPPIVTSWAQTQKLPMTHAINLDGGSASLFFDGMFKLEELTQIGSMFCIR